MGRAKLQIFEQFAELARVLGHAHRLELIEYVAQGERSVERLAQLSGLSAANASQHLKHLRRGGFVQARRDGKRVLYSLADGPILSLIAALRTYAERNRAEVGKIVSDYFHRLDALEPVSRKELARRLKAGSVVVLDVRPEDEFALGHVSGALNIPVDELKRRLAELPRNQEIVAYCRGAYCVFSFEAVAFLRRRGYAVRRLEDGFPEWKAAGLGIEAAAQGRRADRSRPARTL
jgi:rhodanese-related sulfurtransferase/DNA-binding transcriptional ArsR family regulator